MKNLFLLVTSVIICAGCESPNIKDPILDDRVKACSAGFSEETQASLNDSLNKAALSGDITSDIKQETKSVIFSEMSDGDKLKAYEDYIACIEKNWNGQNEQRPN